MARRAWQKRWLLAHWAIGLFGGLLFALMGLTGSALVFYQAIDEWLNVERLTASGSGSYRSFDEMAAAAQGARPEVPGPYGLFLPQDRRGVVTAWFKAPVDEHAAGQDLEVTIDPYSAEVLSRDRVWGETPVSFVYELHKGLWLGQTGEVVVGVLALFLLCSIATGLYLWWPKPGQVRQALTFQSKGSVIRRHYDVHKLSGLAGAPLLMILACTGLYLEFPEYVVPVVAWLLPIPEEAKVHSTISAGGAPLLIDHAVAIARARFPDGEVKWIGLPQQAEEVFQIGLRQPDEVRRTSGESIVWVDQFSGAIVNVRDWRTLTAGETVLAWLFPLHNGEAFGLIGRWIVCAAGLCPSILFGTALRMWWMKRQAHRRQQG
ncbi:MAG: PepSY domain-containing protein [Nitrospira sp.]|nr:PepSY domain-containing protein [Nitrospira sp.]